MRRAAFYFDKSIEMGKRRTDVSARNFRDSMAGVGESMMGKRGEVEDTVGDDETEESKVLFLFQGWATVAERGDAREEKELKNGR